MTPETSIVVYLLPACIVISLDKLCQELNGLVAVSTVVTPTFPEYLGKLEKNPGMTALTWPFGAQLVHVFKYSSGASCHLTI